MDVRVFVVIVVDYIFVDVDVIVAVTTNKGVLVMIDFTCNESVLVVVVEEIVVVATFEYNVVFYIVVTKCFVWAVDDIDIFLENILTINSRNFVVGKIISTILLRWKPHKI